MKIRNGAARNRMKEFERQCYDWGWLDAEDDIVKYLQSRINDLKLCHKNDSCSDIAYVLEGCIEDIKSSESLECLTEVEGCSD